MSVAGIILDKSYRTQLSVAPLHCVSAVPVAPEKCRFFTGTRNMRSIEKGVWRGRLLKNARHLTRPTPAHHDAPFRGQGRSELLLL